MKTFKKIDDDFLKKIETYNLSSQELALCFCLVNFLTFNSNKAVCSLRDIESLSKLSKKTVLKSLKRLVALNIISRESGNGNKNTYTLSYAFFGCDKNDKKSSKYVMNNDVKSHQKVGEMDTTRPKQGGENGHHHLGEMDTTPIYIDKKNKNNIDISSSNIPRCSKEEDDDFFQKINLCKQYLSVLKELNLVSINTSESHYLMGMYKNNEKFNTWENLKEQLRNKKQEILQKTTKQKSVKNQFYETTDASGNKIIVDRMGREISQHMEKSYAK